MLIKEQGVNMTTKKPDVDNKIAEDLALFIKLGLILRGLTLTELAGQVGMTAANLSVKIKRGSLRYVEVIKIAATLGYQIQWATKEATEAQEKGEALINVSKEFNLSSLNELSFSRIENLANTLKKSESNTGDTKE